MKVKLRRLWFVLGAALLLAATVFVSYVTYSGSDGSPTKPFTESSVSNDAKSTLGDGTTAHPATARFTLHRRNGVVTTAESQFGRLLETLRQYNGGTRIYKGSHRDADDTEIYIEDIIKHTDRELSEILAEPDGALLLSEFLKFGEVISLVRFETPSPPHEFRYRVMSALRDHWSPAVEEAMFCVLERPAVNFERLVAANALVEQNRELYLDRVSDSLAEAFQDRIHGLPAVVTPESAREFSETALLGLSLAAKYDRAELLPDLEMWALEYAFPATSSMYALYLCAFTGTEQAAIIQRLGSEHPLLRSDPMRLGALDFSQPAVREYVMHELLSTRGIGLQVFLQAYSPISRHSYQMYQPWMLTVEAPTSGSGKGGEAADSYLENLYGYEEVLRQLEQHPAANDVLTRQIIRKRLREVENAREVVEVEG